MRTIWTASERITRKATMYEGMRRNHKFARALLNSDFAALGGKRRRHLNRVVDDKDKLDSRS